MPRKSRNWQAAPPSAFPVYHAALYARLSQRDKDKDVRDVSNSIENQIHILRTYLAGKEEFSIVDIYADDGATGVHFQRPEFIRMMEDVKQKKINCILVKDLSRLGRSYLETGNFLEMVFPLLGIRFISITDNFDSAMLHPSEGYLTPLKNLMNESYVRDISMKEKSVKRAMMRKGHFMGGHPAYGYRKSPQDKHRLEIDEEAAETVRLIFQLAEMGYSDGKIAGILNEQKILPPKLYFEQSSDQSITWKKQTVLHIVTNELYIGNLVQGKRESFQPRGKRIPLEKERWIVVKNNHEPIISQDQFQHAQEARAGRRKGKNYGKESDCQVYSPFCRG